MYKINKTDISEVIEILPEVYDDNRGKFYELWNHNKYSNLFKEINFSQDNISHSSKNVIRGLHYQFPNYQQDKLVSVIKGTVFDVAVDIRKDSPSFGKWVSVILDDKKCNQLWIPKGFAHGFCVISNLAIVLYKCTEYWSKDDEKIIRWDDPDIKINWPTHLPKLSNKDKNSKLLSQQKCLPTYHEK